MIAWTKEKQPKWDAEREELSETLYGLRRIIYLRPGEVDRGTRRLAVQEKADTERALRKLEKDIEIEKNEVLKMFPAKLPPVRISRGEFIQRHWKRRADAVGGELPKSSLPKSVWSWDEDGKMEIEEERVESLTSSSSGWSMGEAGPPGWERLPYQRLDRPDTAGPTPADYVTQGFFRMYGARNREPESQPNRRLFRSSDGRRSSRESSGLRSSRISQWLQELQARGSLDLIN
ncbi:MAG: hypothetical protein M1819_004529 [Sarea resinae]|nr:MAG: hypothetical protein M1819_004529 [Sarea resinae]